MSYKVDPRAIILAALRDGQDDRPLVPRQRMSSAVRPRQQRKQWKLAQWVEKRLGLFMWGLLFVLLGANIMTTQMSTILGIKWVGSRSYDPPPQDPELLDPFSRDVHDSLVVIGHGVRVEKVRVHYLGDAGGAYAPELNEIVIAPYREIDKDWRLFLASHECVHALFTNARLDQNAYLDPDHALRVEETAAYVLGAHIAGRVVTARGGDGEQFMKARLDWYRSECDPKNPKSRHKKARRMRDTMHINNHRPERVRSIEVHFWSPWLVDEIDAICRANPDPWDAAHVIARKYRLIG